MLDPEIGRECLDGCGEVDPSRFYRSPTTRDGLQSYCMKCAARRALESQWRRQGVVGMTVKRRDALHERQRGKCFLCLKAPPGDGKRLDVDHDRETGRPRMLLCGSCRRFVGRVEEDMALALKVIDYINLFRSGYEAPA